LCASEETRIWVAEVDGEIVGFVGTGVFDPELTMGEISILAVDPDHQGSGIGTALTEFALDRLAEAGMRVAMVETGGDPGHAPARRTYEGAGFTLLPVARYFKNL
jgi:GNAT superfamily N-acetyltransferase